MRNWVLTVAGIVIASVAYVALRPSPIEAVGTVTTSQAEIVVAAPLEAVAKRELVPNEAPALIRPFVAATLARTDREAQADAVSLVEALGATGGEAAVVALVEVLDRGGDDIALQTLATQQLLPLGDGRGQAAVDRYAARLRALPPPSTDFERQLRAEGLAAAAGEPTE